MNAESLSSMGRYRLVKLLGQGSMGVVHEAVDTRLGRTVAIKTVLRSRLADASTAEDFAQRFEREAQAAARLNHPHIVAIFDFGEEGDASFIVMEFVQGRELAQAFEAQERYTIAETVRMMCELLAALGYAHDHGIVHRDIKPDNVMIDGSGRVKLMDFGVARVTDVGQDRTQPGTVVGTLGYMSPEQILGMAVGPRTDLFAAGVVLYQFLTGRRPFSGGALFEVQRKIVQDEAVPPSLVNPEVPRVFDAIVARALAKQPAERYDSAARFAADLQHALLTMAQARPLAPALVTPMDIDLDATVITPWPGKTPVLGAGQTTLRTPAPTPAPTPRTTRLPTLHSGTPTRRRSPIAPGQAALLVALAALAIWLLATLPWESQNNTVTAAPAAIDRSSAAAPTKLPPDAAAPAATPSATPSATAPAAAPPPIDTIAVPALAPPDAAVAPVRPPRAAEAPRRAAAEPARSATREATPSRPAPGDPRCAELLQRMQLGDALTPEQTTLFHTRCVR